MNKNPYFLEDAGEIIIEDETMEKTTKSVSIDENKDSQDETTVADSEDNTKKLAGEQVSANPSHSKLA
jgi:hypothetical protein